MSVNNPTIFPSNLISIVDTLYAHSLVDSRTQKVKVSLTDTQVLALHTTPILCVSSPGSGYAIRVLAASGATDGAGAYSANLRVQLYTNQTLAQFQSGATFLDDGSGYQHQYFTQVPVVSQTAQIDGNVGLYLWAPVANPSGGASTLTVYITYEIIAL